MILTTITYAARRVKEKTCENLNVQATKKYGHVVHCVKKSCMLQEAGAYYRRMSYSPSKSSV